MSTKFQGGFNAPTKLDRNGWITPPEEPDPKNLPEPLGWTLLVRPYPVVPAKKGSLIMPETDIDYMNYVSNIGRVVAIGPCCWNKPEHRDTQGKRFDWVSVGDFVSYPKHAGARIKYQGVSYIILSDEEVVQRLSDPQVFNNDFYKLNIPEDHLTKYNTIYKSKDTK
jgi:co-chaperonin GroES (HSP10)